MILTTLSDLPLLFFLWCRKINCCYMYNVHYYLQRCRHVALSPLFSSLFRCDSVCCFFYIHMTCLLLTHIVVYITLRSLSPTVDNIVYFIQHNLNLLFSDYSIFYNRSMLCSIHHIHSFIFSYQRQTMVYLPFKRL